MSGLVLYHRPGCHLCEQMLAALYVAYGDELDVRLVNVDDDEALKDQYGMRVPVLAAEGQELCEARLDEAAVDAYFYRRAGIG
ncbi:MAG TPA: glutaredoxin family protein [Gammaproteobacteria bacterium]|nr:glutaredoxin family protein [Gammaproteobacteria bacterium]